jgi:hypothetical protein
MPPNTKIVYCQVLFMYGKFTAIAVHPARGTEEKKEMKPGIVALLASPSSFSSDDMFMMDMTS